MAVAAVLAVSAVLLAGSGCTRNNERPDAPVEITFWYAWGGYEGKFLVSLVDEFNRTHPRIRVKPSFFNIGDKLLASIAGGKPPDVATVWEFMVVTMGESGCFLPLEDRLSSAGVTRDDYLPNIWEYGMYGRHKWGVPTTLNVFGMYYAKKMVREAGLDPEKPPRTRAELELWADRLTQRDERGRLVQLGYAPVMTPIWIWNFGGQLFDPAAKRFTLDSPRDIAALDWMAAMYGRSGGMDAYRRFAAGFGKLDSPQNPLFVGKMAVREDGQWFLQFINKYCPSLEFGVFPYPPQTEGGESWTQMTGSFWVIPKGTKHPREAWEFLSWLIAPPQSARFCAELLNIPPMREAIDHPAFLKVRQDPNFDFFVRLVADGRARPGPSVPVSQQFSEAMEQETSLVFSGQVAADKFMADLNRRMNRELERAATLLGTGDEE
jgi:multiple sugar transport system substrate-binding protein